MKVRVNDCYVGALTMDDFVNVINWEKKDDVDYLVNITFKDVANIEQVGDGLRIVFEEGESHYFYSLDYITITIF